jgi:dipeptidyl aminopeptidase/acylaminoacyl peptidase
MVNLKKYFVCLLFVVIITPDMTVTDRLSPIIELTTISWSPDGKKIAVARVDSAVQIWDVESSHLLQTITNEGQRVDSISWRSNNQQIATIINATGRLDVWNVENGSLVTTLWGDAQPDMRSLVRWSPDGQLLASLAVNNEPVSVKIWKVSENNFSYLGDSVKASFYDMSWSPNSNQLAVANIQGVYLINSFEASGFKGRMLGQPNLSLSIAWNADGTRIVSSDGSQLYVFDVSTGTQPILVQPSGSRIVSLTWSPLNNMISGMGIEGIIYFWDAKNGLLLNQFPTFPNSKIVAHTMTWSPHGGRFAFTSPSLIGIGGSAQFLENSTVQIIVPSPTIETLQLIGYTCLRDIDLINQLRSVKLGLKLAQFKENLLNSRFISTSDTCYFELLAVSSAIKN